MKPPKSPNNQGDSKEVVRRRQEKTAKDPPRDRNKYRSCPDIGGATPYRNLSQDNNVRVNVKIYRSYGTLNEFWQQQMRESRPDVRIYRKSTGNLLDISNDGSRVSLPPARGQLVRSRSADRSHSTPNGLPRGLELWKMKSASLDRGHDRVTTPSTTLSSTSARECKSALSIIYNILKFNVISIPKPGFLFNHPRHRLVLEVKKTNRWTRLYWWKKGGPDCLGGKRV